MKRLAAIVGVVVAVTFAGCGGSSSDVGQAYVDQLSHVADALDSVKDEASAREAAHEIAKANTKIQKMVNDIDAMDQAHQMTLFQKHAAEMSKLERRISQSVQRIVAKDPKLLGIVGSEIQDMPRIK